MSTCIHLNIPISYRSACAIPDQDNDEVVITGGIEEDSLSKNTVSVYNEAGWQRDLSPMNEGRYWHACASFMLEGERVNEIRRSL